VRDLIAILRRNGEQMGRELKAPNRWSDSFSFIVRDEFRPTARLDYPPRGSLSLYIVRRSGPGMARLTTPTGDRYELVVGGPGEHMDHNGLELAFRDMRRPRAEGSGRPASAPNGQRGPNGGSLAPATGQLLPARLSSPPMDDPWL
jgi:hypothetical protein